MPDLIKVPTASLAITAAAVANQSVTLSDDDVARITGPAADDRDFIQSKFDGLYFTPDDRAFLDSAWSHIDLLEGAKQHLALAALVLAAARKQPHLVYLDPPYAPPKDDNCYIKRYHFLEGLSVYWRGQEIMENTRTKKLVKRFTPFSYKRTIVDALRETFKRFGESTIVLSYSSNAVPDALTIEVLLREVKDHVEVREIDHRYHFGTHQAAERRQAVEYLFVGR